MRNRYKYNFVFQIRRLGLRGEGVRGHTESGGVKPGSYKINDSMFIILRKLKIFKQEKT